MVHNMQLLVGCCPTSDLFGEGEPILGKLPYITPAQNVNFANNKRH